MLNMNGGNESIPIFKFSCECRPSDEDVEAVDKVRTGAQELGFSTNVRVEAPKCQGFCRKLGLLPSSATLATRGTEEGRGSSWRNSSISPHSISPSSSRSGTLWPGRGPGAWTCCNMGILRRSVIALLDEPLEPLHADKLNIVLPRRRSCVSRRFSRMLCYRRQSSQLRLTMRETRR
jgi:hypothetical protein